MTTKNPLTTFSTRATHQGEPIPGSNQVPNSAGGFAWSIDDWARLRRFLILGVDGPSYYASARQLVKENAEAVLRCIAEDGPRTIDEIVNISVSGRNPKQQPVVFALAACAAAEDPDTRALALDALPKVCRTGTQLFLFAGYVEQFRGWGRGLRRAVSDWYLDRDADSLAYQLVKYQQRDGWSHRDLLRLAKPRPERGSATDLALGWATGKVDASNDNNDNMPSMIRAFGAAQRADNPDDTVALVTEVGLPWEALKSEHLTSPAVWRALLPTMGLGALVRNLARMTANATLEPGNDATRLAISRINDADQIRQARLHPIAVLTALMTYKAGRGTRGKLEWDPIAAIVDALDEAFYLAFGNVEPAGARTMLALDVSGSMTWGTIGGVIGLNPRVASAAMAAVTLATEPSVETVAFTSQGSGTWSAPTRPNMHAPAVTPLPLSPKQRLDDILSSVDGLPFGGTDCALPMLYATEKGRQIDHFVVYTDSETWSGEIHPAQALRQYRERSGIDARLTVVGMVSNGFSIADPNDAGMLDVVGFDSAAPQLIADFAGGRL